MSSSRARRSSLSPSSSLLLNYQYGLSIMVAPDMERAALLLKENGDKVACVCVIKSEEITSAVSAQAFCAHGPLFLIMPTRKIGLQRMQCSSVEGVYFSAWEKAFSQTEASLQHIVGSALEERGIGNLFQDLDHIPYPALQQQVDRRLRNINTLPTLPEIVMRIVRMVNDPKTTPDELEKVLCTDPSIVMKLLQVMRSPVFTGTAGRSQKLTLKEIITRLGVKKVGAIAQQVKMINSLVKPDESEFDLKRFWEHSVGSAIIADKLQTDGIVRFAKPIEFNEYWIGALLHDVGKLVLGFFFWDWFVKVQSHRAEQGESFRQAEVDMGDVASHARLGQLMLLNSDMGEDVVAAVGRHHEPGDEPSDLVSLVYVADNLAKDLGLGYLPGEVGEFDDKVLTSLKMTRERLDAVREDMSGDVVDEIRAVVAQCM